MNKSQFGILIVSLDFELFWGMQDICSLDEYKENILGVWDAVPRLLKCFKALGVHATWATVGFLFADSFDEIKQFMPKEELLPTYSNSDRSAYRIIPEIATDVSKHRCFLAASLIQSIAAVPGQEIGCHTFSHYYCLEPGQSLLQFKADIEAAQLLAKSKGYLLKSIIFPRNQCNASYIQCLSSLGMVGYRSREMDWIHRLLRYGVLMRIIRLLDAYFPLTGSGSYLPQKKNGIWNFPGTRMYRPFFKSLAFLEKLKIFRIKRQMLSAAKHHKVFHLWWHPHNIGAKIDFHLKQLNEIFEYYQTLQKKYGMQSMNMAEAAAYFESHPQD